MNPKNNAIKQRTSQQIKFPGFENHSPKVRINTWDGEYRFFYRDDVRSCVQYLKNSSEAVALDSCQLKLIPKHHYFNQKERCSWVYSYDFFIEQFLSIIDIDKILIDTCNLIEFLKLFKANFQKILSHLRPSCEKTIARVRKNMRLLKREIEKLQKENYGK